MASRISRNILRLRPLVKRPNFIGGNTTSPSIGRPVGPVIQGSHAHLLKLTGDDLHLSYGKFQPVIGLHTMRHRDTEQGQNMGLCGRAVPEKVEFDGMVLTVIWSDKQVSAVNIDTILQPNPVSDPLDGAGQIMWHYY